MPYALTGSHCNQIRMEDTSEKLARKWKKADFEIKKPIGIGRFATVFSAIEKESRVPVALKNIKKSLICKYNFSHQLRREVEIQSRLNHPNIIQLYGYFQDSESVWLVQELAEGGCLYDYLSQKGTLPMETIRPLAYQLVSALTYLEERHIMHRDIKLENILLDKNMQPKIADFGWASHSLNNQRTSFCGTVLYLSPEMINKEDYSNKIDIWSVGILLYELASGSAPFYEPEKDKSQVLNMIKEKSLDEVGIESAIEDKDLKDLIRKVKQTHLRCSIRILTRG